MTCCFIGHREICDTSALRSQLYQLLEKLITEKRVDVFLFGSKSKFNSLCYALTTQLQCQYPHIQRVYVRSEFPVIRDDYQNYLMTRYEDSYYPENIIGAGRSVYIKRNEIMIDQSQYCVFYYQESYKPENRNSGTRLALNYALKHKKTIFLFPL